MVGQVFQVLTEFRFEVGDALLGTKQLQGAVEGVSSAADQALTSFQRLGVGIVANLGLGDAGLLGILYKSITSFDKFRQTQIAFANVLGNAAVPFEDRMGAAAEIMEKMNKLASEFALPVDDLVSFTKVIAPLLNNKGLAGFQFGTAIDMSRNLLKSAPTLGVDPQLVQGQLLRMIEGQASMGDTLFTRLSSDTKTMRPFLGKSQGFNALPEGKRVETISKALKEFASDSKVLEANVNTLRGQMQLLSNSLTSMFSVLRPIGETLMGPIIAMMRGVNKFIQKEGVQIIKQISRAIEPWAKNPEKLLATLMQLSKLKGDVHLAGSVLSITGALLGLHHVLGMMGITIPYVSAALAGIAGVVGFFGKSIFTLGATFGGTLNLIVMFASRVLVPLMLLVGVFQLLSRAIAIARINDAKELLALSPMIAEIGARFSRIIDVFMEGFDAFAEVLAPVFQVAYAMNILVEVMDSVSTVIALAMGAFQGLLFGIFEFVNQVKSAFTGGGFNAGAIGEAFSAGTDQMIERILGKVDSGDGLAKMTTNISKVEITNTFKEQQEPDRIAFTLKEQLLKAAQNPTQRRGNSFAGATVGG